MKKIFYIEKEAFLRKMLESAVTSQNASIYTVDSTDDCLFLIKDLESDIVLLDIKTAGNDLVPFIDSIKVEVSRDIKIIGTGSSADIEELDENVSSKFAGFVNKPISPTGIVCKIIELSS